MLIRLVYCKTRFRQYKIYTSQHGQGALMGVNEPKRGSMFEAFTSRLNETLETAKNDFKSNLSKKFTVAATNLSTVGSGGGKTKLLWKVLEHSKASLSRLESKLEHIKSTEGTV